MTGLVVVGGSGFGREVLDVYEAASRAGSQLPSLHGVIDDCLSRDNLLQLSARNITYLGTLDQNLDALRGIHYTIGIGDPHIRAALATKLERAGATAQTLIHPRAEIGSSSRIRAGTVVCGGAQISTNVQMGRHVHINPGAIIGHDTVIADFVSINPGAIVSGSCTIETQALIGAGATVLQQITVARGTVLGAAACLTKSSDAYSVLKGVPAR